MGQTIKYVLLCTYLPDFSESTFSSISRDLSFNSPISLMHSLFLAVKSLILSLTASLTASRLSLSFSLSSSLVLALEFIRVSTGYQDFKESKDAKVDKFLAQKSGFLP